ncbi:hypothetical protein ScalyP_jg3296 [Parmales sp. scaly parma]|nr:hypothetical protein ScalyP_jg3296 [Parmales sp. scaly parma]
MKTLLFLLSAAGCTSYQCGTHCSPPQDCSRTIDLVDKPTWISDHESKDTDNRTAIIPDRVTVDLDLPPIERWVEVGKLYQDKGYLLQQYFEDLLPDAAVQLIAKVASEIVDYPGFASFSDEMKGYAKGLNIDLGYVVAANLVYQLEDVGIACDNWNNTGPSGQCDDDDWTPDGENLFWAQSNHFKRTYIDSDIKTGVCTSIVANEASDSKVIHGRNLDWNLEEAMRGLILTVDFTRGGKLLYTGSTIVSFVGLLNAMKPGEDDGFSFSMDARCQGGNILFNLLQALKNGAMTPCQHSRQVMETSTSFADAVKGFEEGKLIDDGYFIVGGSKKDEGAIVTRTRNHHLNTRVIDASGEEEDGWYRLETNYDWWKGVPSADDRRTPGVAKMDGIGKGGMDEVALFGVMKNWPTYNPHTDLTCIMVASDNTYDCVWWSDAVF